MSSTSLLVRRSKPTTDLLCFIRIFNRPMGGGPRTFPGGLNKWQWKRMHEKKAREKEKRLLQQEKQLYEARIRSQIRAKLSSTPDPSPQSTTSHNPMTPQDHIKALADRFMKEGAEDLWNEDDGPLNSDDQRPRLAGATSVGSPIDLRSLISNKPNRGNVSSDTAYTSNFVKTRNYSVQSGTMFGKNENPRNVSDFVNKQSNFIRHESYSSEIARKVKPFANGRSCDSRNVSEYIKNRVPGGRRRFKRNESSSSSDDDDLDFELEDIGDKVEGWKDVKKLGSSASLGKYDVKITKRRVPLNKLEEETDFSEQLELIKKDINRNKLVENAGEKENGEKETILSQKR